MRYCAYPRFPRDGETTRTQSAFWIARIDQKRKDLSTFQSDSHGGFEDRATSGTWTRFSSPLDRDPIDNTRSSGSTPKAHLPLGQGAYGTYTLDMLQFIRRHLSATARFHQSKTYRSPSRLGSRTNKISAASTLDRYPKPAIPAETLPSHGRREPVKNPCRRMRQLRISKMEGATLPPQDISPYHPSATTVSQLSSCGGDAFCAPSAEWTGLSSVESATQINFAASPSSWMPLTT